MRSSVCIVPCICWSTHDHYSPLSIGVIWSYLYELVINLAAVFDCISEFMCCRCVMEEKYPSHIT